MMNTSPSTKTVLVTGCTPGGIGYELCKSFQLRGCTVIATARRPEVLEELAGSGMIVLPLDVTDSKSISACKKQVQEVTGGRLDILVNNAGVSHTIPAADIDIDDVRKTFETNVFGLMAMTQSFLDLLIAAKGLVVNMSSLASITPYVYGSVFCATKGAINSYSRTLRQEVKPFGVRVMVVMTGFVKTTSGTKVYRELPKNSIYKVVEDAYLRKLRYSENTSKLSAQEFSFQLVERILEGSGWFWPLWGPRNDWVWLGGSASLARWATWIGEWVLDTVLYRKFGLDVLEKRLRQRGLT
ncbi:unnamed protein product [Clonostachys rosea]|uniref:Ketoreductase domain-containing protein n=1 Tax=Bionectria ochroleuca TaxID=29856 RepID=A0ABY6UZ08_BIOOC|nr:unnamed protein product [Clonostachys rosea]